MGANRRSRSCVITFKCIVAVLRIYKTVTYANLYVYILVNKFTERERVKHICNICFPDTSVTFCELLSQLYSFEDCHNVGPP